MVARQDLHDFAGLTTILFILKNPVHPVQALGDKT